MTIIKIHILRQAHGGDRISLITDVPEPWHRPLEMLSLDFNAPRGAGPAFVALHWPGIPVEVQIITRSDLPFSNRKDA